MMTKKKKAFIAERRKDPKASGAEIARRAGYSANRAGQRAWELEHDKDLQDKLQRLGDVGLDALEDVAVNDKNGIARASAAKVLVETAFGKPKDNPSNRIGNVTINVNKLSGEELKRVIQTSVDHSQSQPLVN